jgi:hypothetical protein
VKRPNRRSALRGGQAAICQRSRRGHRHRSVVCAARADRAGRHRHLGRKTGKIEASGNIRAVDESGNVLYTDKVELTDELKAGAMQDLLVVLREGRLAARQATRDGNGNLTLHDAAFSGCAVENEDGCPKKPSWEVTAVKVTWNEKTKKVHYSGATLRVFGIPCCRCRALPIPATSAPKPAC